MCSIDMPRLPPRKKGYCVYCGGRLKPLLKTRTRGIKNYVDWESRRYHLKCYNDKTHIQEYYNFETGERIENKQEILSEEEFVPISND